MVVTLLAISSLHARDSRAVGGVPFLRGGLARQRGRTFPGRFRGGLGGGLWDGPPGKRLSNGPFFFISFKPQPHVTHRDLGVRGLVLVSDHSLLGLLLECDTAESGRVT